MLGQTPEVEGIEDIAVQDKLLRHQFAIANAFQQFAKASRLAVAAAQVDVGKDNGVVHGLTR